ncbi:MAG TPA: YigZ family protein [Patescibacteria group bacterium]|nr:YigZ family protein [Patescibacteria group bacterium]
MTLRAPARSARFTLLVLGSRFIAQAAPVDGEEEARAAREAMRREFPDATHHCWGLILRLPAGERALCDDAGEPAGTAGPPILQAIRRAGVTDALVIVARWFGGTRLGKGGLARAYRSSAGSALAAAGVVQVVPMIRLQLAGPVEGDGAVRHLIARRTGRLRDASYDESGGVLLLVELPESERAALEDDLAGLTRGAWRAAAARGGRSGG